MTYVHEGATPENVPPEDTVALKEAAEDEAATPDVIESYTKAKVMNRIFESFSSYANWYLILVACTQVRELTDRNLQNFSQMCGAPPLPARVKSFLKFWAANQTMLSQNDRVRDLFSDNLFFEYHTTGSSTPNLCLTAMAEVNGFELFSPEEVGVVNKAFEENHDIEEARKIPSVTLVKTSAVLEAAGTLPDIWYMGQKARDKFSGKKYSALVKFLKEIFRRQTAVSDLGDADNETLATNFEALVNSFPKVGETLEPSEEDGEPVEEPVEGRKGKKRSSFFPLLTDPKPKQPPIRESSPDPSSESESDEDDDTEAPGDGAEESKSEV
jgi:hypothetical protein